MTTAPRRLVTAALLLAWAIPLTGCYTFHAYQIGGEGGREAGNQPGTEWRTETRHAFLWGLVRQDLPIDNCQTSAGKRFHIEEFKVRTNFLYALLTVLSLGTWVPLEVSWRCAKSEGPVGSLD